MPWHNSIKVVVNFATSGSEVACFELDPSQTAQDIQQELYRLTGAPGYRQRLLFENEVLEPQRRLQDLGFARELSLLLIVQDVFQHLGASEKRQKAFRTRSVLPFSKGFSTFPHVSTTSLPYDWLKAFKTA